MKIPSFTPHQYQRKVRQAYEEFVGLGKLALIRQLKIDISLAARVEILRHQGKISEAKCFLLQREIAYAFNSRLVSKIAYALQCNVVRKLAIPKQWIKQIEQISEVSEHIRRDSLGEEFFRVILVLRSIVKVTKYLFIYVCNLLKKELISNTAKIYVVGHTSNLFQVADGELFDFSNWISLRIQEKRDVHFMLEQEFIQHIVNGSNLRFLAKSLLLTLRESVYLMRHGINLVDALSMQDQVFSRAICTKSNLNGMSIFFTESSGGIRPYWTYGLEQQGIEVGLVNFSNSGIPSLSSSSEEYDASIILQNWTNIYCCTYRQFEQISKYSFPNREVKLKSIGVPWYRDELTSLIPTTKKYIAVFDFETHKNHFGITTMNELGYGHASMNEKFLLPIIETAHKLGFIVVHKPKRKRVANKNDPASKLIEKLGHYGNYLRLDPQVSPVRVILDASCVVSMPPTTTALIARELDIPSVYYDYSGQILPGDCSLENVDLVSSQFELEKWLQINSKI